MIASNVFWKRFYAKFENTINELRWYDKPILTSKISITSFAEFDIKIVFLGQNNFE